ncbi:MAG: helix-turn-helix transcriptional regulator [bacterium]
MTEPLWTADDVARHLGVSAKFVRCTLRYEAGFPPPLRVGRLLRWHPSEVLAWLQGQRESRTNHGIAA